MVIHYFGEGSFRLQSGETSLLLDPKNTRFKADLILRTLTPLNLSSNPPSEISFPGEYEVKGLEIHGWPVETELTEKFLKTIYCVRWEDMSLAFLGHLSQMLEPELLEKLGEPDILFLPFDGEHFLSLENAAKIVKHLEPRLVITSFSKSPKEILRIFGQKTEPIEKLVFKKKDIVNEQGKIIILENSTKQ